MIFGWDVSTSIVGVSAFDDLGSYSHSNFFDMRKIESRDLLEKSTLFAEWTRSKYSFTTINSKHYIEDRLGNFAFGRTSIQTLMKLAAFNLVVSYILKSSSSAESTMKHIHPTSVKAYMKREGLIIPKGADKKQMTLDYVQKREPSFPRDVNRNGKPQPYLFDMADAYIVARAGIAKDKKENRI